MRKLHYLKLIKLNYLSIKGLSVVSVLLNEIFRTQIHRKREN